MWKRPGWDDYTCQVAEKINTHVGINWAHRVVCNRVKLLMLEPYTQTLNWNDGEINSTKTRMGY